MSELELDLGRYELRRGGRPIKLEKKPMELLIFLVARREQLVTRQEIVGRLWRSDLFVDTEPNINNIVRKIRAALGDNPDKPRFLETVVGKGYRFVGPVRVVDARFSHFDDQSDSSAPIVAARSSAPGERTSLAVLPLFVLGNISDDRGICLGFADALVSRLGNLHGLDVLPTSAIFNVPMEMSAAEVGARLGVRFVLRGAIRESKGQWHISLELFDTQLQSQVFTRKTVFDLGRHSDFEVEIAGQIAGALNRPFRSPQAQERPRYSKDPYAYAEFMRGYRLCASGDPALQEEAAQRLSNAVSRDPNFSLAHATLSVLCATRHFEFDPARKWLEKAEFHCRRAIELDPDLAEARVAHAFLLWGPSKNFQHLEAIAELRRALVLQKNLPHAYNRLGTILAHVGLLDHARAMYERARQFHPRKQISHSILQVYMWNAEHEAAREEISAWREESPTNKYPIYFAPQLAMMTGDWKRAKALLEQAARQLPEEPMIVSLLGLYHALRGKSAKAMYCLARACSTAKSFGHAHHTYYQVACILAVLEKRESAFEWLERSVSTGFACWPFFLKDPCLQNLRAHPEFDLLISSLQGKYPDHLGLL